MCDQKMSAGDAFPHRQQVHFPDRARHPSRNRPRIIRMYGTVGISMHSEQGGGYSCKIFPGLQSTHPQGMQWPQMMHPLIPFPRCNAPRLRRWHGGGEQGTNSADRSGKKHSPIRRPVGMKPTEKNWRRNTHHRCDVQFFSQAQGKSSTHGKSGYCNLPTPLP